jgi:branched-chain amino acid transport system ATP-binding protein
MIDEPTEGLSPQMVNNVEMLLKKISSKGVSILLVEQKLTIAFNLSNRLYVMGHGKVVYEGRPREIKENKEIIKEWLEVS